MKPRKPIAPIKPSKQFETFTTSVILEDDGKPISLKALFEKLGDVEIEMNHQQDDDGYYSSCYGASLISKTKVFEPNLNYDNDLKLYKKKLSSYKKRLEKYNKDFAVWQQKEDEKSKTAEELKRAKDLAMLKELKEKYESNI